MIRNRDFAIQHAGHAVASKNGEYAGVVVGWNDMLGVILGVDHGNGWQTWSLADIGVSDDEFMSYEYRNAGTLEEPDERGNVQAAHIRGKHGAMQLVSMGEGLGNVSSKTWEEKVWKH